MDPAVDQEVTGTTYTHNHHSRSVHARLATVDEFSLSEEAWVKATVQEWCWVR